MSERVGRPLSYTEEIGEQIAEMIAGDMTLQSIGDTLGIAKGTIVSWMSRNEVFAAKCACARVAQGHIIDEEIGQVIENTKKGTLAPDVARVVLSGLQWRAAKKAPKVYGDAMTLKGDKENPLELNLAARLDKAIQRVQAPTIDNDTISSDEA